MFNNTRYRTFYENANIEKNLMHIYEYNLFAFLNHIF
jgi:hypothetical protein